MNTENNILIAEFLGFQKTDLGWYDFEETLVKFESDNTFDFLLFDTDWNWLMEVVEKISSPKSDITNVYFSFKILPSCISIYEHKKKKKTKIAEAFCIDIKEGIYEACVEFINWYNQQNYESKESTQ